MNKKFGEYYKIISECFEKENMSFSSFSEDTLEENLEVIDVCIDCLSNVLCKYGFGEDWEPNAYGLKIEEIIGYLLKIRYNRLGK